MRTPSAMCYISNHNVFLPSWSVNTFSFFILCIKRLVLNSASYLNAFIHGSIPTLLYSCKHYSKWYHLILSAQVPWYLTIWDLYLSPSKVIFALDPYWIFCSSFNLSLSSVKELFNATWKNDLVNKHRIFSRPFLIDIITTAIRWERLAYLWKQENNSYFLLIETFTIGGKRQAHKSQEANKISKFQETPDTKIHKLHILQLYKPQ